MNEIEGKVRADNIRYFLESRDWRKVTSKDWLDPVDSKIYSLWEAWEIEKQRNNKH